MATITLKYDARNVSIKKLLEVIVSLGGQINPHITKKSGIDEAMDDLKAGRIYKAKDVNDMMKQILG